MRIQEVVKYTEEEEVAPGIMVEKEWMYSFHSGKASVSVSIGEATYKGEKSREVELSDAPEGLYEAMEEKAQEIRDEGLRVLGLIDEQR